MHFSSVVDQEFDILGVVADRRRNAISTVVSWVPEKHTKQSRVGVAWEPIRRVADLVLRLLHGIWASEIDDCVMRWTATCMLAIAGYLSMSIYHV